MAELPFHLWETHIFPKCDDMDIKIAFKIPPKKIRPSDFANIEQCQKRKIHASNIGGKNLYIPLYVRGSLKMMLICIAPEKDSDLSNASRVFTTYNSDAPWGSNMQVFKY